MSGLVPGAARSPAAAAWGGVVRRAPKPLARGVPAAEERPIALLTRTATFAALLAFAAGHWAGLVADPSTTRTLGLVVAATAGGVILHLTGRPARFWLALALSRPLIAVTTGVVGLLVTGLPAHYLKPRRFDDLWAEVDRALGGVGALQWPYAGGDDWVRLSILLGAPVVAAAAAALAFWPARRLQPALRHLSLILLVALYGVAATDREFDGELLRGLLLFLLIAAWLWIPRLRRRDAIAGGAVAVAAALVSLPVAARLKAEAWIDYRSWEWFGPPATQTFNWNHRYGPIDWPREGTTVLEVKSERPHYWKAQTLDRFDGLRWVRSNESGLRDTGGQLPERIEERWDERIRFTVRSLESPLVIGAGTVYEVRGAGPTLSSADGTTVALDEPLADGERYTVRAYVPDPSRRRMRAAADRYGEEFRQYTTIFLPPPGVNALTAPPRPGAEPGAGAARYAPDLDAGGGQVTPGAAEPPYSDIAAGRPAGGVPGADRSAVSVGLRGQPLTGAADAERRLLDSPYGRTFRLARRLAAGQTTTYDIVKRIEDHLQRNLDYNEQPPSQEYPLEAFLFEDRVGYCQQFSGAMALMLRMNGIPARVAAGFTPGSFDREQREYRVRDLDAHSWVEVFFTGIGWVPFDPTPSLAPAESQAASARSPSAADAGGFGGLTGGDSERASGRALGGRAQPGEARPLVPLLAFGFLAVLASAAALARRLRRRGGRAADPDRELRELRRALGRLGFAVPAGTTLLGLERQLEPRVGRAAIRHVRLLRHSPYGAGGPAAPEPVARRALRRALTRGAGPLGRLRGLMALPPRPF